VALDGVKYYTSHRGTVAGREVLLARTGYTGEDGFVAVHAGPGTRSHIWRTLSAAGAAAGLVPAGLAARDTLRLEAGCRCTATSSGRTRPRSTRASAGWSSWTSRVISSGWAALAAAAQAPPRRVLVGLRGGTRRVPRHGYPVLWDGQPAGTVTSGAPSPTLGVPIAMAYVEPEVADAGTAAVTGAARAGRCRTRRCRTRRARPGPRAAGSRWISGAAPRRP